MSNAEVVKYYESQLLVMKEKLAVSRKNEELFQALREQRKNFESELETVVKLAADAIYGARDVEHNPYRGVNEGAAMKVRRAFELLEVKAQKATDRMLELERMNTHLADELFKAKEILVSISPIAHATLPG